jgi:hypothetical protein
VRNSNIRLRESLVDKFIGGFNTERYRKREDTQLPPPEERKEEENPPVQEPPVDSTLSVS